MRERSKSQSDFLMLPHRLTNFEIQRYDNEPKFDGTFLEITYLK